MDSTPLYHPQAVRFWGPMPLEDDAQDQANQVSQTFDAIYNCVRVSPVSQLAAARHLPPVQFQSSPTQSHLLSGSPASLHWAPSTHSYTSPFPNTDTFTFPYTDTFTFPNTNAFTFPNTDVFTFHNADALTHYNSNQERPVTTSARSISTVSDFSQSTISLTSNSPVERAVRMRALNKEDQGARSYTWAELKILDKPTHDSLRWAEQYFSIYLARDRFPSRHSSNIDEIVDAGITLYTLEHGVPRPGKFPVLYTPSSFYVILFLELKVSTPCCCRHILNAINRGRSNDASALETQILQRELGFLNDARGYEANLSRKAWWFGSNFDFIDFVSPVRMCVNC